MPPSLNALAPPAVLEELRSSRNLMDGVIPDLPTQQTDETSFALGSCQYPGGFVDEATAHTSYRSLVQRLEAGAGPRFVVLTGDQVYTDATAGLFDPSVLEGRYTLPYHRWLRSRAIRTALRQAHSFMLLDDHEIENDWEASSYDTSFQAAIRSYLKFQRSNEVTPQQPRFFSFRFDGFPFFMLDTRTRRESRSLANIDSADLLDGHGPDSQFGKLAGWVQANEGVQKPPMFIASPAMLLPRHREAARWDAATSALHSDGWDGYPASLHSVLALVAKSSHDHFVFLSGDEHLGCIATITITLPNGGEKVVHSIHTPGLYTPYAFANRAAADWRADTDRSFVVGGDTFFYTTNYTYHSGEGFAYINLDRPAGEWHLTCQFGDGPTHTVF